MRRLVVLGVAALALSSPAGAQQTPPNNSDEILRQRLLLQERFNKGYDVQIENAHDRVEARCKAEAKKRFSALHPIKRRKFTQDCIERARR